MLVILVEFSGRNFVLLLYYNMLLYLQKGDGFGLKFAEASALITSSVGEHRIVVESTSLNNVHVH